MNRLYLQIYGVVLAVILIFAILMAGAFWLFDDDPGERNWLQQMQAFAEAVIPPTDAPPERLDRFARAIAEPFEVDLTIYDASGGVLVRRGRRVPAPPATGGSQWIRRRRGHGAIALALSDGRWIVVEGDRGRRPIPHLFAAIAMLTLATGLAVYPLVRRLTRRLEVLKEHVEALGDGRLDERVPVEGSDEIAKLAGVFNRTADRIERLVADKTRLLANTSHELRTPLARVRMAIALLHDNPRPELLTRIDRDIEELDELIGELLVASRLEAPEQQDEREPVDLLALAAEEAARLEGVEVRGVSRSVHGNPRLLRRLVRNLLENALRHGEIPVEVEVNGEAEAGEEPSWVRLVVADRGPGIPESERERIFEPFYRPEGQASSDGGIGLGLALVRQIAERHAGRVRCESRAGGGTRFVLELPAG
jgi:two-component system OmpR family sensor kinase